MDLKETSSSILTGKASKLNYKQESKIFMDLHPEIALRPTSEFSIPIFRFKKRFDYVENPLRDKKVTLHRVVKDGKFGIIYFKKGIIWNSAKIILPAKFEYIEHRKIERIIDAVQNGKLIHYDESGILLK